MTDLIYGRFVVDTEHHALTVLRDDGLYRHLRCRRPGTGVYGFDVVTWPGYLAYVGDMGAFVFSRLDDMFQFFGSGDINPAYWSEKCVAAGGEGVREFSEDVYLNRVEEWRDGVIEEFGEEYDADGEFMAAVQDELLDSTYDMSEEAAYARVGEFRWRDVECYDSWEWSFTRFTDRYLWACYAITRAIGQYRSLSEGADRG